MTVNSKVFIYIDRVLDGRIPAGSHVKNAVNRFVADLDRDDLVFIPERAEHVIKFISKLRHSAGRHEGTPFILEPWQEFIIFNLYGFYWKDTGRRRFRTAYIEVARKSGKTALAGALCLYHLIADGEGEPQVLLAANSKEQAKIAFDITRAFARKADPLNQVFKIQRNDILRHRGEGFLKVLPADDKTLDGYNCSFGLIDEWHSAKDARVRDVLRSGQGMRDNPMLLTVTTAGYDKSLPCYELRTVCIDVLAGHKVDDSMFSIIFSIDDADDWRDPEVWIKSNPNLGVTVTIDFLKEQITQAINNPSDEVGVLTKNMNVWCDSAEAWISDQYIIEATAKFKRSEFKDYECFVGVDLASNLDLTAVAYMFAKDDKLYFDVDYYLPADSLQTRPDKELYRQWRRSKELKITPGNVTDYEYITHDILAVNLNSFIVAIAYDSYNSTQWAIGATNEGLPLEQYSQTPGNFNKPTKEFERLIMSGRIVVNDNAINRYCMRNVELRMDRNGNVKPDKGQDKKKIDGVIAMLQALSMYHIHHREFNLKIF